MRTAIIHDWLVSHGGAEQVLKSIYSVFPGDIFTLLQHAKVLKSYDLPQECVRSSFLEKFPMVNKYFKYYLPFFPCIIEQFDLRNYDIIISSSHCVAKGVLTTSEQLHVCYCHSPMRYIWDMYQDYLYDAKLHKGLKGWLAQIFLHKLRMWDFTSAQRVDHFIANSQYIARRIKKTYGKDATVIYPPVNVDEFSFSTKKEDFYVTASRLVSYKRIELIVEAFNNMPTKQLMVIGSGADLAKIKAKAQPNISILGFLETEELKKYLQKAKAFVFAALEDFGILPVEAQSCGTPVVCLGQGGTAETVIHGKTGVFFQKQTVQDIQQAIEYFETLRFDPYTIRENALKFSQENFKARIADFINTAYSKFQQLDA